MVSGDKAPRKGPQARLQPLIYVALRQIARINESELMMRSVSGILRGILHPRWIIPPVEQGDYLPIREAAKAYATSQDTLYRLLAAGRLKRYRREMDKKTWLKRSELDVIFTPKAVDDSQ